MLTIVTSSEPLWNEESQEFVYPPKTLLRLEHSLVSISKWESKWKKPFLDKKDKTESEMMDYVRFMTLNEVPDDSVYYALNTSNYNAIGDYINNSMTATKFPKDNSPKNKEPVTSELIYYWMVAQNIPFECQYWHLNRLLALIKVCDLKNRPPKKLGANALMRQHTELNKERRSRWGSRG